MSGIFILEERLVNEVRNAIHGPVFELNGDRMRSLDRVLNEIARSLQFPSYFGGNQNALLDCLRDLSWLAFGEKMALFISSADDLLMEEPEHRGDFLRVLRAAQKHWNTPIHIGEAWDREAVDMTFIFQARDTGALNWTEGTLVTDSKSRDHLIQILRKLDAPSVY